MSFVNGKVSINQNVDINEVIETHFSDEAFINTHYVFNFYCDLSNFLNYLHRRCSIKQFE